MKVAMAWYGGPNYAPPRDEADLEHFKSIDAAVRSFASRPGNPRFPCCYRETPAGDAVDKHGNYLGHNGFSGPEALLYIVRADGTLDEYPDLRVCFGPRGGVRVERT